MMSQKYSTSWVPAKKTTINVKVTAVKGDPERKRETSSRNDEIIWKYRTWRDRKWRKHPKAYIFCIEGGRSRADILCLGYYFVARVDILPRARFDIICMVVWARMSGVGAYLELFHFFLRLSIHFRYSPLFPSYWEVFWEYFHTLGSVRLSATTFVYNIEKSHRFTIGICPWGEKEHGQHFCYCIQSSTWECKQSNWDHK